MTAAIVLMGVSGSGKSTLGAALADALGAVFIEGDALHPPANVAKMRAGIPLTDEDRAPWLEALAAAIAAQRRAGHGVVATCSALKRVYRDRLRAGAGDGLAFILLETPRALLERRLTARPGHYMPASLLESQLATLEPPGADERVLALDSDRPVAALVAEIRAGVGV